MFVNVYNLKVLGCPSAFRAKSIYHVCIEMRQSLVLIHHCRWLYHCFVNKNIAERLFLSRGILETCPKSNMFDLQQR